MTLFELYTSILLIGMVLFGILCLWERMEIGKVGKTPPFMAIVCLSGLFVISHMDASVLNMSVQDCVTHNDSRQIIYAHGILFACVGISIVMTILFIWEIWDIKHDKNESV